MSTEILKVHIKFIWCSYVGALGVACLNLSDLHQLCHKFLEYKSHYVVTDLVNNSVDDSLLLLLELTLISLF